MMIPFDFDVRIVFQIDIFFFYTLQTYLIQEWEKRVISRYAPDYTHTLKIHKPFLIGHDGKPNSDG